MKYELKTKYLKIFYNPPNSRELNKSTRYDQLCIICAKSKVGSWLPVNGVHVDDERDKLSKFLGANDEFSKRIEMKIDQALFDL